MATRLHLTAGKLMWLTVRVGPHLDEREPVHGRSSGDS